MAKRVGLKLKAKKCKTLKANDKSEAGLTVGQKEVEEVDRFTYLGANVTEDGGSTADVKERRALASTTRDFPTFGKKDQSIPL